MYPSSAPQDRGRDAADALAETTTTQWGGDRASAQALPYSGSWPHPHAHPHPHLHPQSTMHYRMSDYDYPYTNTDPYYRAPYVAAHAQAHGAEPVMKASDVAESDSSQTTTPSAEPRVRRPMNSFMLFAQKYRPILHKENPLLENKIISKLLGQKWKELSNEERATYVKAAVRLSEEHRRCHPNHKFKRVDRKRKGAVTDGCAGKTAAVVPTFKRGYARNSICTGYAVPSRVAAPLDTGRPGMGGAVAGVGAGVGVGVGVASGTVGAVGTEAQPWHMGGAVPYAAMRYHHPYAAYPPYPAYPVDPAAAAAAAKPGAARDDAYYQPFPSQERPATTRTDHAPSNVTAAADEQTVDFARQRQLAGWRNIAAASTSSMPAGVQPGAPYMYGGVCGFRPVGNSMAAGVPPHRDGYYAYPIYYGEGPGGGGGAGAGAGDGDGDGGGGGASGGGNDQGRARLSDSATSGSPEAK